MSLTKKDESARLFDLTFILGNGIDQKYKYLQISYYKVSNANFEIFYDGTTTRDSSHNSLFSS